MSFRLYVEIDRGMTDKTPVCVFPWEVPLLQELHGANARVVSIEEMLNKDGVVSAKPIAMPFGLKRQTLASMKSDGENIVEKPIDKGIDFRESLIRQTIVPRENDPILNLDAEWARLIERYGMHPSVEMTVAEKVYTNYVQFRQIALQYRRATPPEIDPLGLFGLAEEEEVNLDEDPADRSEKSPSEMNGRELRDALAKYGVHDVPRNAKRDMLVERLIDAMTHAEDAAAA